MDKTIEQRLRSILDAFGLPSEEDVVKPSTSFVADLGLDSLDTVELVVMLEEEFGLEIPDEEAEKLTTFGEALEYLTSKLPHENPPA